MDLIGKRFTKLIVIKRLGSRKGAMFWLCQCDCGNTTEQSTGQLNARRARRCGYCVIQGPSTGRGPRKAAIGKKISNNKLFVKNRRYVPTMKHRIIQEKLISYECGCGNIGTWCDQELTLQLDHIDGDRTNNTLANFRFMCPNCHTQQTTWGRKRFKKLPQIKELLELAQKYSNRQLAKMFDCSASTVSHSLRKHYD